MGKNFDQPNFFCFEMESFQSDNSSRYMNRTLFIKAK